MSKKSKKSTKKSVKKAKKQAKKPTKVQSNKAKKTSKKPDKKIATLTTSNKYPRHERNPYRPNSSYGLVFDVLVKQKDGITRQELSKIVSEEGGKPASLCSYDVAVVISGRESATSTRHKSAKEGYWVRRENDHLTLMID
jgi:flagellar biosynthesis/type III secretory pathway M-ring protein FliF/YscJ